MASASTLQEDFYPTARLSMWPRVILLRWLCLGHGRQHLDLPLAVQLDVSGSEIALIVDFGSTRALAGRLERAGDGHRLRSKLNDVGGARLKVVHSALEHALVGRLCHLDRPI